MNEEKDAEKDEEKDGEEEEKKKLQQAKKVETEAQVNEKISELLQVQKYLETLSTNFKE